MPGTANSVGAQVYLGTNISWGLGGTEYTISGVGALFQTSDAELKYDEMEVKDQRGNVKAWVGYNPVDTGTLEYVVNSSGTSYGTASMTYPTQGTQITIGASADEPISGSNWIVQTVTVRKSNTDAAKVSLKVIRYKGIT
jgi:hypothetical protein